ncbi:MAG TPA: hypothetical protein VH518_00060 [Tepidisphaeraceae bacterium]|jgi:hypothetical protein
MNQDDSTLDASVPYRPVHPIQQIFSSMRYNPFFLLSALCMLAGLFSLNDSLDWSPIPAGNLLWLLLILNVYELLLVGLGIFLARRGLMRDAGTLFILEAFFLVDAGFLNSEIFTHDFELGLLVNLGLMVLAFVKIAGVFRGLRIPVLDVRMPVILLQMFLLLAAPGILKYVSEHNRGTLPPLALYAMWWVLGFIPIVYLLMFKATRDGHHGAILNTFVLLPAVSIIAHLSTSNWVYHVPWYHGNISPLLLGLAVAVGASDAHVRNVAARMRFQLLLPVVAILLAMPLPQGLGFDVSGTPMSPLRVTLLASVLVYVHGMLLHRHPYFGIAGTMCFLTAGLGHSPEAMTNNAVTIGDRGVRSVWKLVPRTVAQWGLVSVACSFLLLGAGMVVSLLRPARNGGDETVGS